MSLSDAQIIGLDSAHIQAFTTAQARALTIDQIEPLTTTPMGWASAADGLLVRDINHDGVINDGRELFGRAPPCCLTVNVQVTASARWPTSTATTTAS